MRKLIPIVIVLALICLAFAAGAMNSLVQLSAARA
jgi:hypothetical protein